MTSKATAAPMHNAQYSFPCASPRSPAAWRWIVWPHIYSTLFEFWQPHDSFAHRNDICSNGPPYPRLPRSTYPWRFTFLAGIRMFVFGSWLSVVFSSSLSICFPLLVVSFNRISVGFIIIFVRRQPIALQCIRIVRAGEYGKRRKLQMYWEKKNCTRSTHTHNGETKIYSWWQTSLLFSDSVSRNECDHFHVSAQEPDDVAPPFRSPVFSVQFRFRRRRLAPCIQWWFHLGIKRAFTRHKNRVRRTQQWWRARQSMW